MTSKKFAVCGTTQADPRPMILAMSEEDDFSAKLKLFRKRKGLTLDQLAGEAGTSKGYLSDIENGKRPFPRGPTLNAIAAVLGVRVSDLFSGSTTVTSDDVSALQLLPIAGRVQAGAWLELDELNQVGPELRAAAPDPRYSKDWQWLSLVVGDSMNALKRNGELVGIHDGDLIHCVSAAAIGYQPASGDLVEVERVRFDGALRERTLKQVEVIGSPPHVEYQLWPRSTNPRWQTPISFQDGICADEKIEVVIRGKVIQVLRSF
jgi:transcriptional regulator with XRE-family HTH domain